MRRCPERSPLTKVSVRPVNGRSQCLFEWLRLAIVSLLVTVPIKVRARPSRCSNSLRFAGKGFSFPMRTRLSNTVNVILCSYDHQLRLAQHFRKEGMMLALSLDEFVESVLGNLHRTA